jgi:hypothetical protein
VEYIEEGKQTARLAIYFEWFCFSNRVSTFIFAQQQTNVSPRREGQTHDYILSPKSLVSSQGFVRLFWRRGVKLNQQHLTISTCLS